MQNINKIFLQMHANKQFILTFVHRIGTHVSLFLFEQLFHFRSVETYTITFERQISFSDEIRNVKIEFGSNVTVVETKYFVLNKIHSIYCNF